VTNKKAVALLIFWIGLGSAAGPARGDAPATEPTLEILQPKMEPLSQDRVDRDWAFFADLPCQELQRLRVYSQAEHRLLKRRQQQCLDTIRAFTNAPVSGGQAH
jgi:hypothetical protein